MSAKIPSMSGSIMSSCRCVRERQSLSSTGSDWYVHAQLFGLNLDRIMALALRVKSVIIVFVQNVDS